MAAKPSPFIGNLYEMTHAGVACINWSADGHSFSVSSPEAFARDVLPTYAKHNNYASFVRQLNMYGFRRTTENKGTLIPGVPLIETFTHPYFVRNNRDKLHLIRRKTPASMPRRIKSAAESDDNSDSFEDQQQLQQQTSEELRGEIQHLRSECETTRTQMQWLMAQNQLLVAQQQKQTDMLTGVFQFMSQLTSGTGPQPAAATPAQPAAFMLPKPEMAIGSPQGFMPFMQSSPAVIAYNPNGPRTRDDVMYAATLEHFNKP